MTFGSGTPRTPHALVETAARLHRADIRHALPREPPGVAGSLHSLRACEGSVTLRIDGVEQRIEIAWQFAGRGWRIFLVCPQCQSWRHHLYFRDGGERPSCRRCCELRYMCQLVRNRLPLRAAKLRRKLGAELGLLSRLPPRPRRNTAAKRFDRLASELARIEARIAGQIRATLDAVEKRRKRNDERSTRRTR